MPRWVPRSMMPSAARSHAQLSIPPTGCAALASSLRFGYVPQSVQSLVTRRWGGALRGGGRALLRMPLDSDAYDGLVESHHRRLLGWFRARVGDRDLAADLAQRTWVEVLERARTFDPERGAFWTFTKIWSRFVLLRHYSELRHLWLFTLDHGELGDVPNGQPGSTSDAAIAPLDQWAGAPAAEALLSASAVFLELLHHVFQCKRLPHEVITFGFVKLLDWKPQRVVAELADQSLQDLAARLEAEYLRYVPLDGVREAFGPLREKLGCSLEHIQVDGRTSGAYQELLHRTAGASLLREYFPRDTDPREAVTRWWSAVNRVLKVRLLELGRGPLAEWLRDRRLRLRSRKSS